MVRRGGGVPPTGGRAPGPPLGSPPGRVGRGKALSPIPSDSPEKLKLPGPPQERRYPLPPSPGPAAPTRGSTSRSPASPRGGEEWADPWARVGSGHRGRGGPSGGGDPMVKEGGAVPPKRRSYSSASKSSRSSSG
ncbi:hypothetical protein FHG87_024527 [Trinorchestia longiramus]|nr:hypothetical protein FHG87_024527 [Trinorchestia longiramus]